MDEWELPGGYLYRDPADPTGVPMDAAAAFKRAAALLTPGKVRHTASVGAPDKKKRFIRVSIKNAKRAVVQIDHGIPKVKRLGRWFKKRTTVTAAFASQVHAIAQHLQQQAGG